MTRLILFGLIAISTAIFTFTFLSLQIFSIAACAFGLGIIWLVLHIRQQAIFDSVFFVCYIVFAVIGTLYDISILLMLLGVSMSLAAWDLARLQAQVQTMPDDDAKVALETNHLHKLGITFIVGLLVALIPMFIQFSLNFVAFIFVLLLVMVLLRQSVLYLRNQPQE